MQTSDQIRPHIRRAHEDLDANISELERKVRSTVDWRAHFDKRPMTVIGLAFGAGVLLSALLPLRKGNSRRPTPAVDPSSSNGALAMAATNRLGGLDELVPGFEKEFAKARLNNRNYRSERTYDPSQPSWQEYSSINGDWYQTFVVKNEGLRTVLIQYISGPGILAVKSSFQAVKLQSSGRAAVCSHSDEGHDRQMIPLL